MLALIDNTNTRLRKMVCIADNLSKSFSRGPVERFFCHGFVRKRDMISITSIKSVLFLALHLSQFKIRIMYDSSDRYVAFYNLQFIYSSIFLIVTFESNDTIINFQQIPFDK